jgi:hypothetical protein
LVSLKAQGHIRFQDIPVLPSQDRETSLWGPSCPLIARSPLGDSSIFNTIIFCKICQ